MDAPPTLGGGDVRRPHDPLRVASVSRVPRIRRSDRRFPVRIEATLRDLPRSGVILNRIPLPAE